MLEIAQHKRRMAREYAGDKYHDVIAERDCYRKALEELEPILTWFRQAMSGYNAFDEAYNLASRGLEIAREALAEEEKP